MRPHLARRAVGTLAACVMLAGCAPDELGASGVTVDAAGAPVLLLLVCRGHVDRAGVLMDDPTSEVDTAVIRLHARHPIGKGLTEIQLSNPDARVWETIQGSVRDLKEHVVYGATSITNDHSGGTRDISFTLSELASLKPGQVLHAVYKSGKNGPFLATVTTTLDDFSRNGCARLKSD